MVCKAVIHNVEKKSGFPDGRKTVDIGIPAFTNNTQQDKKFWMPAGKNDWGMAVTVSGCGDDYAPILYEHDHNIRRGQNAMVFQDGRWFLHRLNRNTTAIEIKRVEQPGTMVGYQNIHYLSKYTVKNGTGRMFLGRYEMKPGVWMEQRDICPGGTVIPVSMHNKLGGTNDYLSRYACRIPKTPSALRILENQTSGKANRPMYEDMVNRLCSKKENIGFNLPNNTICAEHSAAARLAEDYCLESDHMETKKEVCNKETLPGKSATYTKLLKAYCKRGANIKGSLCSELSKDEKGSTSAYETIWRDYCDKNPNDSWCACYNAVKDAASDFCKTNPTAAGCVKVKQNYGKLVEKTPSDEKAVWSGMQPCFGGVCSASNTFKPEGYNASCDKTVSVCIQDFTVEGLRDSQINATCEINNSKDSTPSVSKPSSSGDSSSSSGDSSSGDKPPEDKTKMYVGIGVGVLIFIIFLLALLGGDGDNYNNYNNF